MAKWKNDKGLAAYFSRQQWRWLANKTPNTDLPTPGLSLLVLHQSIDLKFWPHQSPEWLFALYSVAFIWPTTLLLSLAQSNTFTVIKLTLPFAAIGGLLGYYVGTQATPIEHISYEGLLV